MKQLEYHIKFNTPAFLGNAEQQAQWRTPPFKAFLRQWWRVVKAKECNYDHQKLREAEMRLLGAASDNGAEKSHQSLVRLRLSSWAMGNLANVPNGQPLTHPEVPKEVGANLYLGYGPIGGGSRTAINPTDATSTLLIRCPDEAFDDLKAAMQLAAWFGTVGSRARNGWGALHVEGEAGKGFADLNAGSVSELIKVRPLADCLQQEWLHALGCDNAGLPLVWRLLKLNREKRTLSAFNTWEEVMHELARIKIKVRTSDYFKFLGGGKEGHRDPQPRHLLSYPSGSNHKVSAWGNNGRLANQVLFKVHRHAQGYAATIAHFPSRLPKHMEGHLKLPNQLAVWQEVHRLLDAEKLNGLSRIKGAQA